MNIYFKGLRPLLLQVVPSGLLRSEAPQCKSIGHSETESYEKKLNKLESTPLTINDN